MLINRRLLPLDQSGSHNIAIDNIQHPKGSVLILHWKLSACILWYKINLSRRQIGNIGFRSAAKSVGLLRFLTTKAKPSRQDLTIFQFKIDLDRLRPGQRRPHLFSIIGNLLIVHGKARVQNHIVHPMHRSPAKTILLALYRQRSGSRPCRNTEDNVVVRINIPIEGKSLAIRVPNVVLEIKI